MSSKPKAAIFFSGRGSNMQALLQSCENVEFVLALTDNPNAEGIKIAEKHGLALEVLGGTKGEMEAQAERALRQNGIELICLAGYMRLLSASFTERWYGRILNIHPSLLPKYKGLHPQQQALDAGEKTAGCSVHLVSAEMDGGPVIAQAEVPVLAGDNEASLAARILTEEHKLYPKTVDQYADYLAAHPITNDGLLKVPFAAIKEECGIFAIHAEHDALPLTIFGLHALQHRGQEGAGIASIHDGQIYAHRRAGLVGDVFSKNKLENKVHLPGKQMIGHLRYSTAGGKAADNLQPFVMQTRFGQLGLAHNGNLTNSDELRQHLMEAGTIFSTDSDSEVFLHLLAQSPANTLKQAIIEACLQVTGAFSIFILSNEGIYAARDALGMRPLCLGMRDGQIAIASESTALEATDIEWQYDIDAGELLQIKPSGEILREHYTLPKPKLEQRFCAFEFVYFMRANSAFNDRYTARVRERIGMQLFNEAPADADYVVPVPESGIFAAIGYAQLSKLPFHFAILKSSYVGRTFIEPKQELRNFGVRLKLSIDRFQVKGKRIVLVDDSIVRANTLPKIIELLRAAGAREVHVRIAAPMIEYPCFYGIDMPSRAELSAANHSLEELRVLINAESLAFVSTEGLRRAIDARDSEPIEERAPVAPYLGTCMACFTGDYPAPLADTKMQRALEGSNAQYETTSPGLLFANTRRLGEKR